MSMNVAKAWTDAYTAAIILLALTHVVVIRDIVLMRMDIHAMVSFKNRSAINRDAINFYFRYQ